MFVEESEDVISFKNDFGIVVNAVQLQDPKSSRAVLICDPELIQDTQTSKANRNLAREIEQVLKG